MRVDREPDGVGGISGFRNASLPGVLLLVLTALVYLPALRAGFVWDDDAYVTENPHLRTTRGLLRIWTDTNATPQYYPMVFSSFWVEYRLWGLHPAGYHAVNVLLHGLNAVLIWRLLLRLGVTGAWVAAAIFAVHPVHVESVAWIAERKNVLATLFYLAAMGAYLRFAPPEAEEARSEAPGARWWYAMSLALYVGALWSKTVTCSLPALLLLLRWWKRGRVGWADVRPLVPFFAVGLGLGLQTVWIETHHVGASGIDWRLSPVERCLIAGRALWFYAGKLAWPVSLCFIYPRWRIDAGAWWQSAFPIGAVAVAVGLWMGRRRVGRGPFAAVAFFAMTLVPALGFFDTYPMRYSFVADHFQYLASVGLIALAAALGTRAAHRLPSGLRWLGPSALGVLLATLGWITMDRCLVYKTPRALWIDTLTRAPDCWMAHTNLGDISLQEGRFDEGESHYADAVRLNPRCAEAQSSLGFLLEERGELGQAADHLERALALTPKLWQAAYNLGVVEQLRGDHDAAIGHLREALRSNPHSVEARACLAVSLARRGKPEEAMKHYAAVGAFLARSNSLLPYSARVYDRAALALSTEDDPKARDGPLAIAIARRVCDLTRSSGGAEPPAYLDTLAAAYAEAGRFDEAVATARRALVFASFEDTPGLTARLRRRLDTYESRRPVRQEQGHPPLPEGP